MAVEYLAGATDAFWWRANNYFMYFNPQTNVWQFLPTDFDYTFGNGNRPETFTKYRDFGQRLPNGKRPYYPLVDKLIYENKEINQKFENILITITKGVFNSAVLNARIDAYVKQIEADVVWDYEIDRSNRPGRDRGWTKADFYKSLDAHVKSTYQGLKPWIKGRAETVTKQLGTSA
ncbi:hypothetical protein BGW38_003803 [Lunasporangiospora selenospora]|uniref:CotH protein n=1 Tax=Lunasporangiospora selenospora TaxID=979761 RepID=A0A9P6FRC6_9FUNG|nr:hypothetical protein BGW38_003803 [Lunasporangiospora selenospora]